VLLEACLAHVAFTARFDHASDADPFSDLEVGDRAAHSRDDTSDLEEGRPEWDKALGDRVSKTKDAVIHMGYFI
jgi:hypothetical protein